MLHLHCLVLVACTGDEIRPLIGGVSPDEGLVQVCVQGGLSLVDLQSLSIAEASVMCRQLNQGTGEWQVWLIVLL